MGKVSVVIALSTCLLLACTTTQAPQTISPKSDDRPVIGEYGADDRLGALNLLTERGVRDAADLVTTGKTYALGMVSGRSTPAWGHRKFDMRVLHRPAETSSDYNATDDAVETHLGIGTQIDGLAHIGMGAFLYNGVRADKVFDEGGVKQYGIETLPPIVTRGVLLDIAKLKGVESLAPSQPVTIDDLEAAMQRQGIEVRVGDVVLIHTGWMSNIDKDLSIFVHSTPGLTKESSAYLAEKGAVAIGADTSGLGVRPSGIEGMPFPEHVVLLFEHGVHILENIVTEELAEDGVHEFMFVLGQPRLEGAVQMIINPVAIR